MITIHLLRILVDVSFYCSFVTFIALVFGGSGAFPAFILQCICFALSYLGGRKRILRLLFLLPMALCWLLCKESLLNCTLLIPTALYILVQVWKSDYSLILNRQQRMFGLYWKLLAVFCFVMLVTGNAARLTVTTIPYAIVMLTCSVLLMRTLRHEPKVYLQWKYQLLNLGIAVLFLCVAYLISTPWFLNACVTGLATIYNSILLPILHGLLAALLWLVNAVINLFKFVFPGAGGERQRKPGVSGEYNPYIDKVIEHNQILVPERALDNFGTVVLVIAIAVFLFLLFRYLNKKHDKDAGTDDFVTRRKDLPPDEAMPVQEQTSSVGAVRAQYAKFLKLCKTQSITVTQSSTSQDINRQATYAAPLRDVTDPIREIYIQARYAGKADKESVRQIKKLCAQGKKNIR